MPGDIGWKSVELQIEALIPGVLILVETHALSLQSIAVAVAATGMASSDEGKLFRFTLRHSIVLVTVIGLLTLMYAYWLPELVPQR